MNNYHKHSLEECPILLTLSLIANKWSIRIIDQLLRAEKHTLRFSQLKRGLSTITQRELTKHLREFEKSGIVSRHVHTGTPLRVDYSLTETGHSLLAPIQELSRWAEKHGQEIQKKRKEFDAQQQKSAV